MNEKKPLSVEGIIAELEAHRAAAKTEAAQRAEKHRATTDDLTRRFSDVVLPALAELQNELAARGIVMRQEIKGPIAQGDRSAYPVVEFTVFPPDTERSPHTSPPDPMKLAFWSGPDRNRDNQIVVKLTGDRHTRLGSHRIDEPFNIADATIESVKQTVLEHYRAYLLGLHRR